jgi:hypothetical protein
MRLTISSIVLQAALWTGVQIAGFYSTMKSFIVTKKKVHIALSDSENQNYVRGPALAYR